MKVHLFNLLLLITVGGCLYLTIAQSAPEAKPVTTLRQAIVPVTPSPSPHPIDAYHAARSLQRSQALAALEALLSSPDAAVQAQAREEIARLCTAAETESKVEGMLLGMGYEKCVCILDEETVLLFTEPITEAEEAAAVLQAAGQACHVPAQQVQLLVP